MTSPVPAIANVIDRGFCIGCGACAAIDDGFKLANTANGFITVTERPHETDRLSRASAVCPFGDAPDEDVIAAAVFDGADHYEEGIGRYRSLHAGWSHEFRGVAGSGGITRWLLARALRSGFVDFVLVVDRKLAGEDQEELFEYAIHETADGLLGHTSSSAYYPVSLADVLAQVRARSGRFAVTALPCFARALRSIARVDPEIEARMALVSGVICGALKSRRYADYLSHQMGVAPSRLGRLNFRGKSLSRRANEKCMEVWRDDNAGEAPDAVARVQNLRGTDYGVGYFKPKSCDYCDDIFAETADLSLGDAWISPYQDRPEGTNVVVVRSAAAEALLAEGVRDGEILLEPLTSIQARQTQNSGLRHRRQGLATRLWFAHAANRWVPAKRFGPRLGSPAFVLTQVIRVLVRRITSADALHPAGRIMPLILRPMIAVHGKLRRFSTRVSPPPPRLKRTADQLTEG